MADDEEHIERPATWENEVVGKATEAVGKLLRNRDIVEDGEAQDEAAHEVRDEFREQQARDHEG